MKDRQPELGADESIATEPASQRDVRVHEVPLALRAHGRLRIRGHSISLRVVAAAPDRAPRLRIWPAELGQRTRVVHSQNGQLSIRVPRWAASSSSVLPTMLLEVPGHVELQIGVTVLSGRFEHLTGVALDLEAQTGSVVLRHVDGRVRAHITHGSLLLRRFRGAVEARLSRGAIRASIEELEPGMHHLEVEVGCVRVELAPGLPVAVEGLSELGSVRCDHASFQSRTSATLRAATKVGSVKVRSTTADSSDPIDGGAEQWAGAPGSGTFRTAMRSGPALREQVALQTGRKLSPDEAELLFEELQTAGRSGEMQPGFRRRKSEPKRGPL